MALFFFCSLISLDFSSHVIPSSSRLVPLFGFSLFDVVGWWSRVFCGGFAWVPLHHVHPSPLIAGCPPSP